MDVRRRQPKPSRAAASQGGDSRCRHHHHYRKSLRLSALAVDHREATSPKASDALPLPLYLRNAVFFTLFFSVAYYLLHRWRDKIRSSVPLHVVTLPEIAAIVSLIASFIYLLGVKAMKNPRSALCKTSIMAASDVFNAYSDKLLDAANSNALDQMLLQLLLKASQDKRFVCEEADRALSAMVGSLTPLPLLHKLRPYVSHFNFRIRAKAVVSISNCVSKMGLEKTKEFGLALLLQMAVQLLNDRLPEAREAARSMVVSMYECVIENQDQKQESWQSFCQSSLPPAHVQSMIKIVSSE